MPNPLTSTKKGRPIKTGRSISAAAPHSAPSEAPVANQITVLLADDHILVRQGLRALLEASSDIRVVGEAEDGVQAVQQAKALAPDVMVLDLAMPVLSGIEATRQMARDCPAVKILILSSYTDDEWVMQLLKEGAIGYLVKQTAASDLLTAIREAKKGNSYLSPSIAKRLADQTRRNFAVHGGPTARGNRALTNREAEVLQLIAEGYSNKEIAAELTISIKTVEKHRQQVMNKLNLHDVAGLTRHAFSRGIIELTPRNRVR